MHAAPTRLCNLLRMPPVESLEKGELTGNTDILFIRKDKTAYTRASNSNECILVNRCKQAGIHEATSLLFHRGASQCWKALSAGHSLCWWFLVDEGAKIAKTKLRHGRKIFAAFTVPVNLGHKTQPCHPTLSPMRL